VHDTELLDEIYNDYIEDIGIFLKYGSVLLMWAIKSQASNVIDKIYNKCLKLFEQDLVYNQAFLSIINESMQLLDKHYPEYIARYSSDTNMILISPKIEQLSTSHLNPFFNIGIINLTPSIAWTKYTRLVNYYSDRDSNALPNWEYLDNPQLTILIVLFSLLIVVYLMNLLIGLLSNAIDEDNNRVSYLVQKAKFNCIIFTRHYHAAVKETRREIQKLKKEGEWSTDKFSIIKEDLLKML
ncbi:9762_t:CDS:2, partial [Funneliformis geosporum]